MGFTFRAIKGSRLTSAEGDENARMARDGDRLQIPKAAGNGLRIGPDNDLTFGWHDIIGNVHAHDGDPNAPVAPVYRGGIKQWLFAENNEAHLTYHLPHDYAPGTDIHIHAHWSHNATNVTGGTVTWGFELIYAKGHNQAAFSAPIIVTELQDASAVQYQHMICEAPASIAGGSANLLSTSEIEVDGVIFGRVYLVSNDLTVSSGQVPDIFLHTVDIHYQTTGAATKRRAPDFYV